MVAKIKIYVLLAVLCYLSFLGWYAYQSQQLTNTRWSPSDVYTQVGNIPETTGSTTTSSADQVFNTKVSVPMTSRSKHRIANYKRTRRRPVRMMTFNKRKTSSTALIMSPINTRKITPVGEGLYMLSSATFRSFGAWGLMNPNYGKLRKNQSTISTQHSDINTTYLYPWYVPSLPTEDTREAGVQSAMMSTSSQLTR